MADAFAQIRRLSRWQKDLKLASSVRQSLETQQLLRTSQSSGPSLEELSSAAFVVFCGLLNIQLSPGQLVLTAVAYDGFQPEDLADEHRELAYQIFGPVDTIPKAARAVLVAVCGARSGKSYVLAALYSLWRMLTANLSTLAPGETGTALVVARDLELSAKVLEYVVGAIKGCSALAERVESETARGITLRRADGQLVECRCLAASRGGGALRGRSLVSAVLDECAFFRDDNYQISDVDIFLAVTPRVLPDGMVVLSSTPWAESGLLYDEFQNNFGHPTTAIAAHAPTLLLYDSPRNREAVAREEAARPDNVDREYGAKFMAAGSGHFFSPAMIRAAVHDDLLPTRKMPQGRAYQVGIGGDLGLVRDASAIVAVYLMPEDSERGLLERIEVADVLELRPTSDEPLKLSEVVAQFAAFARRHGRDTVLVDHHALEPAKEHAGPAGINLEPVQSGQAPKVERFVAARDRLNAGRVWIPGEFRRVALQLADVTSKPTAGGGLQITQPRKGGVHGDIAAALVLALHSLEDASPLNLSSYEKREGASHKQRDTTDLWGINLTSAGAGSRWDGVGGKGY